MNRDTITNFDLVECKAVIDKNFVIIRANEALYRFIGISNYYTIIDVIHQVDFDDFVDVVNGLRLDTMQSMVLRMRRVDNSYRWMLVNMVKHRKNLEGDNYEEFVELDISDILVLKSQNGKSRELLIDYVQFMSMDNELMFFYNPETTNINVSSFINDDMVSIFKKPISELGEFLLKYGSVDEKQKEIIDNLIVDIINGKEYFSANVVANFIEPSMPKHEYNIMGKTIFENDKAIKAIGSIQLLDVTDSNNTIIEEHTFDKDITKEDVYKYFMTNLSININSDLTMILIDVNQTELVNESMMNHLIESCREAVKYRGIVGKFNDTTLILVIKDISDELCTRAFIESLRSNLAWKYLNEYDKALTFSIGVSRYPFNGRVPELIYKKAERALEISHDRGPSKYILYKEKLHGELTL